MKVFKLLFFFLVLSASINAQPYLVRYQNISVEINDTILDFAWAGGLNIPQFSNIDFNEDGKNDLFVFDKSGNVILPFIQHGTASEIDFSYSPSYSKYFPKIHDWALLRDYNCDGYMDIFTYSDFGPGAMVYENNGQTGNNWFSIADSILYTHYEFDSSEGDVNIFISSVDLPAIYDFDEDGDLDIFTFQLQGFKVEFHKNNSQENEGECGLEYDLKNRCWGYFTENEEEEIILGQECSNVVNPEFGDIEHHSGSTLLMLDINNDGFEELVMGDINYSSLTTVINGGPSLAGPDSVTSVNYNFPYENDQLILHTFPASFYVDVNNDDVKDFIAAPNAQYISDNVNAVQLFLNNGEDDNPDLAYMQNDFLQGDMIDVGEGAYPVLEDINQDGLMDLVIGNRKRMRDSITTSSISYFENIGTSEIPSFSLVSEDVFDLTSKGIGEALYPSFMDLNGDNSKDIIIGNLEGELYYLLNTANENEVMQFPGPAFPLLDDNGDAIDVGQLSKPFIFDLDNDNLLDLIIGERSGRLTYYENSGSLLNPSFSFITDTLGDIQSPGFLLNTGYSAPFFYKEGGQVKLILGSETGEIQYYNSISNNLTGVFTEFEGPASNLYEGKRSTLARYDLNNDGLQDLIIGNYRGGLSFFKGDLTSEIAEKAVNPGFILYPNPANNKVTISLEEDLIYTVNIYNQLGQKVFSKENIRTRKLIIDVEDWQNGQYIIQVDNVNKRFHKSLLILH